MANVTSVTAMVDMTLIRPLNKGQGVFPKVKVIHFGTNRFSYMTSHRLSMVTFALGRTV